MANLKLSLNGVNYLNIGLMFISLVMAVTFPFELFLFAYAVLGPLHYMTEIGWLHNRNYFALEKRDFIIPTILCAFIGISMLLSLADTWESTKEMMLSLRAGAFGTVLELFDKYSTSFIFLAFTSAIFMVTVKNRYLRYGLILAMIVPAYFLESYKTYQNWFAIFLPTIIHVSLFTALFILFGALKSKSISGYLSFGFYFLCVALIFMFDLDPKKYILSEELYITYQKSTFASLNIGLWEVLAPTSEIKSVEAAGMNLFKFLNLKLVLKIQAFIAFAYTYHYLNWFSKTEIIRWHDVSKSWLAVTGVVWVVSVSLYYYDYRTGLLALFFLSMLHVFLEFPLNVQSIIGIGKETLGRFTGGAAVAGTGKK